MDSLDVDLIVEWETNFRLTVPWLKVDDSLPTSLNVRKIIMEDTFFPLRQQRAIFHYRLEELPRGGYHFQTVNVLMGDALGLITRRIQVPLSHHVMVYPRALHQKIPMPILKREGTLRMASLPKDEGDQVIGARPYQHGDRMQKIHWGASARTGTLVTKEFEHSFMNDDYLLLLADDAEFGVHTEAFEHALSLVASYFEWWQKLSRSSQFWLIGEKIHTFSCDHGHLNTRALDWLAMVQPEKTDLRIIRDAMATIPKSARVDLVACRPSAELTIWLEWARTKKWQLHLWLSSDQVRKDHPHEDSVMANISQMGIPFDFYGGGVES